MIVTYLILGLGWALGAAIRQLQVSSSKSELFKTFLLNVIGWPIYVVITFIRATFPK